MDTDCYTRAETKINYLTLLTHAQGGGGGDSKIAINN
jgi:hypothetical protein